MCRGRSFDGSGGRGVAGSEMTGEEKNRADTGVNDKEVD